MWIEPNWLDSMANVVMDDERRFLLNPIANDGNIRPFGSISGNSVE